MTPEALTALLASIEEWEAKLVEDDPGKIRISSENCPLCVMFVLRNDDCGGCPIAEHTRYNVCHGSPYHDVRIALHAWRDEPENKVIRDRFRADAQRMIEFMKALVPEEEG